MDFISSCYGDNSCSEDEYDQEQESNFVLDLTFTSSDESEDEQPTTSDLDQHESSPGTSASANTTPSLATTSTHAHYQDQSAATHDLSNSVTNRKYAIRKETLPQPMLAFLKELRTYFLKSVNLERQKAPITQSTMDKAQERILCKCS